MPNRAPIGPFTVTVLCSHWRPTFHWDGFRWERAELRERSIWGDDYHLAVPWMHPDDRALFGDDPECECIYRVRVKRPWKRFVQVDGVWMVER